MWHQKPYPRSYLSNAIIQRHCAFSCCCVAFHNVHIWFWHSSLPDCRQLNHCGLTSDSCLRVGWHFWRCMRVFMSSLKRAFHRFMDDKAKWSMESRQEWEKKSLFDCKESFVESFVCVCENWALIGSFHMIFDRDRWQWRRGSKWINKKVTSSHFHKSSLTFICGGRCLCN